MATPASRTLNQMKGVVFAEFLRFAETKLSPIQVQAVVDQLDLSTGGAYTSVGKYPAGELTQLAEGLATATGQTVSTVMKEFGRSLFPRLATTPGMISDRESVFAILSRLDHQIHPEVQKLYADAELPQFAFEVFSDQTAELRYASSRQLGDLAEGLIWGVADYTGELIEIERLGPREPWNEVYRIGVRG